MICHHYSILSSFAQSYLTLCDPMNCSTPGLPVHHQLPELTQTHVHRVGDAIQPSHPLLSPSPPAFNLSQHQGLSSESVLLIRWPKYWSFSFSISPSNEPSGIWFHHFMANRWGNSGTVSDFIFWGSKITADGDCSHETKRRLLLGRKVMTNLDSIFKSRDITLPTKVHLVKVMVFPVVMYGCESWTVKKAEC